MAIENNIVKPSISVSEVSQLLGCADTVAACCTSANINKWAKNKPVCNPQLVSTRINADGTYTNMPFDFGLDHNKGNANMFYGIKIPSSNGNISSTIMQTIENFLSNNPIENDWKYYKPRGNAHGEPYRLGDFAGYFHNFNGWCVRTGVREYDYVGANSSNLTINRVVTPDAKLTVFVDFYTENSPYIISKSDFPYTLCCMLTKYNDSTGKYMPIYGAKFCEKNINEGDTTIELPMGRNDVEEGKYRLYYGFAMQGTLFLVPPFDGIYERLYLNFTLRDNSVWTFAINGIRTYSSQWITTGNNIQVPYGGNNIYMKIVARGNGTSDNYINLDSGLGVTFKSTADGIRDGVGVHGESSGNVLFCNTNLQVISTPKQLYYDQEYIILCEGAVPVVSGVIMRESYVRILLNIGFEDMGESSSISSSIVFKYN